MDLYVIHVIFGASELIQGAAAEQGYKQLFPTHRMRSSVVHTGDLKFHFTLPLTEIASQIACLINGPLQKDRMISIAHSSETEKKLVLRFCTERQNMNSRSLCTAKKCLLVIPPF